MTRVLFLTKYTEQGSSSRYRVYQFLPSYTAAGLGLEIRPFHTSEYVRRLDADAGWLRKARQVGYLAGRAWQRLAALRQAGSFDLVVVEGEVFPLAPAWADRLLWAFNRRVVVEYDDALFVYHGEMLEPAWLRRLVAGKVASLMGRSRAVIAGNAYLAEYAAKHNPRVEIIPTAIDTERWAVASPGGPEGGPVRLGWIGSPATARYLAGLGPALAELARKRPFVLRTIGAPALALPGVEVEALPWRLESEVADLQACHIGLMPLDDDAYSRGKCGLKLLQYMAIGIPAVASPVGVNAEIVRDGENGYLAGSDEEWVERLTSLIDDAALRRQMGLAGRETVERDYSLTVTAPRLLALFQEVAAAGS